VKTNIKIDLHLQAMYHLVMFTDGTVEIIHETWIESKEGSSIVVAFPPKKNYPQIRSYLRNVHVPHSTWNTFSAEILLSNGKCSYYTTSKKNARLIKSAGHGLECLLLSKI